MHGRDAILRIRAKWLIFNMILQLWADVKSHVPTGFCFSPKASGFYPFGDATALAGEGGVRVVVWLIQASALNQTCHSTNDWCEALASPKGCFLCFCFSPPSIYPLNLFVGQIAEKMSKIYLNVVGIFHIQNIFRKFVVEIMGAISRRFPSGASHSLSLNLLKKNYTLLYNYFKSK